MVLLTCARCCWLCNLLVSRWLAPALITYISVLLVCCLCWSLISRVCKLFCVAVSLVWPCHSVEMCHSVGMCHSQRCWPVPQTCATVLTCVTVSVADLCLRRVTQCWNVSQYFLPVPQTCAAVLKCVTVSVADLCLRRVTQCWNVSQSVLLTCASDVWHSVEMCHSQCCWPVPQTCDTVLKCVTVSVADLCPSQCWLSPTAGCLLLIPNYTGDRLNFGMAAERAQGEGIRLATHIVGEDCALASSDKSAGRRGLTGIPICIKVGCIGIQTIKSKDWMFWLE